MPTLDRIFATHGIPSVLKSDNGPPFFGEEFKAYMIENGIDHQRITPLWPQANSEAENFMKPLTKAVHAAMQKAETGRGTSTDSSSTIEPLLTAPQELLHPNYCLAAQSKPSSLNWKVGITPRLDDLAKEKMKQYTDKKSRAQLSEMKIGDTVLIRQINLLQSLTHPHSKW